MEELETHQELEARCFRFGEENKALHTLSGNLNAEITRLREALTQAVQIAREGCLVPPDGGSPTAEEVEMCERIADRIAALVRPNA